MKLHLRYRPIQEVGFLQVLCSRKYYRAMWLCSLTVLIMMITYHLNGEELGIREFDRKNFVGGKFKHAISLLLKNSSPTNTTLILNASLSIKQKSTVIQNSTKDGSTHTNDCQRWCHKKNTASSTYFLSGVLLVRIYSSDLAKLSTRELLQWLYYLKYAGFEHVYVYDAYVYENESQKNALEFLVKEDFVTYVDWSHNAFPYSITGTQESAYQHCLKTWGNKSYWQASIDMDEYPFCPEDTKPNFMQRFIANFSREQPRVSQITMKNFLFLGKPLSDKEHPILIDRLKRRTHRPANDLVKPIYKTSHIKQSHVHHHDLSHGFSVDADENKIRLNHYWGARLQNWGEDTPEILSKTMEDNTVEEIVRELQKCDHVCLPDGSIIHTVRWNWAIFDLLN